MDVEIDFKVDNEPFHCCPVSPVPCCARVAEMHGGTLYSSHMVPHSLKPTSMPASELLNVSDQGYLAFY